MTGWNFESLCFSLEAPPKTPPIQNFCVLENTVPEELPGVGSLDNKSQAGVALRFSASGGAGKSGVLDFIK